MEEGGKKVVYPITEKYNLGESHIPWNPSSPMGLKARRAALIITIIILKQLMDSSESTKLELAHPFIKKLFHVLSSEDFEGLFFWSGDEEFSIKNSEDFEKLVLDPLFKLSKFKTFTRLLYRFGFKKTRARPRIAGISTWSNPLFRRQRGDLLYLISKSEGRMDYTVSKIHNDRLGDIVS